MPAKSDMQDLERESTSPSNKQSTSRFSASTTLETKRLQSSVPHVGGPVFQVIVQPPLRRAVPPRLLAPLPERPVALLLLLQTRANGL